MNPSEILFKAAEAIDRREDRFACVAIKSVAAFCSTEYDSAFGVFSLFSRYKHADFTKAWFGAPIVHSNQNCRVLALLFAAEIAKDAELSQP